MKSIFFVTGIIFCLCGFAQNEKADSLLHVLKNDKADTGKVNHLNALSEEFENLGNFDTAFYFGNSAITLCLELLNNNPDTVTNHALQRCLAVAYNNTGNVCNDRGNYGEALKNFTLALQIRQTELPDDKKNIAMSYNNIGLVYENQGNYPDALQNHLNALKIREQIGNEKGTGMSYNNLGNIYSDMGDNENALKNYFSALSVFEKIKDQRGIAYAHTNLGYVYYDQGKYEDALKNYFAAIEIKQRLGDKLGIANAYTNIACVYASQGDESKAASAERNRIYDQALVNFNLAKKSYEEMGDQTGIAVSYNNLGNIYRAQKKYNDAFDNLRKGIALSTSIGNKENLEVAYSYLTLVDSATGNFADALRDYKLYVVFHDSLVNDENTRKSVQSEMQYTFDKKEAQQKAEQVKKDAVAESDKKKQKIILFFVMGGLILVVVFAGFIYRSFLQKKKVNVEITKQKNLVEEKQKEILDSIHYAKRIQQSLLPTERYIDQSLIRQKEN